MHAAGETLALVPLSPAVAARLAQLPVEPQIFRELRGWVSPELALGREFCGMARGVREPFAVVVDGVPVGLSGLSRQGLPFWQRDVYYWVALEYWGRRIATRAVAALIDVARDNENVSCLSSIVREGNVRSRAVLGRNGFVQTHTCTGADVGRDDLANEPFIEFKREIR